MIAPLFVTLNVIVPGATLETDGETANSVNETATVASADAGGTRIP